MDPTQAFILQSAMNQRAPSGTDTMGLPPGMNVPPPAGAPVAPDIPGPSSSFRPMPMKQQAPRSQETMGNAAMQAIPEMAGMGGGGGSAADDSPIFKGIKSAMNAGRESYQMTDEQRNRAEGEAIMAFFGNMANSKNSSVLGSMSESFMPALAQYKSEEARAMGLNKEVIDTTLKRQHEERLAQAALAKLGGAGGMKVGNQISLLQSYNTKLAAVEDKRDKLMAQAYNNLTEEQRGNPSILASIEAAVEERLRPDLQGIESLKNYALANGFDIDSAMGNFSPPNMGAPQIQNPALNVPKQKPIKVGNGIAKDGTDMKQISTEQLLAAANGGQ